MPFPLIPIAIAAGSAIMQGIANRRQAKKNMELAKFQADANQRYIDAQNKYNTPKAQMARYADAGLNPQLIYSQGSPGNQSQPNSFPEIGRVNYSDMFQSVIPVMNQTAMTMAQTGAIDAKTRQTYAMTELNKMQTKLISANPLLDDAGFKATIDGLKASAELKAQDSKLRSIQTGIADMSQGHVVEKVFKEVQLLEQRFNLGEQDKAIKAQVLKSKEFQNAILEVQKKFMTDGDVTPQHILQFIQMLLLKAF